MGRNQSSAGKLAGWAGAEKGGGHLARWARTWVDCGHRNHHHL